jgi:hypothetical protein
MEDWQMPGAKRAWLLVVQRFGVYHLTERLYSLRMQYSLARWDPYCLQLMDMYKSDRKDTTRRDKTNDKPARNPASLQRTAIRYFAWQNRTRCDTVHTDLESHLLVFIFCIRVKLDAQHHFSSGLHVRLYNNAVSNKEVTQRRKRLFQRPCFK